MTQMRLAVAAMAAVAAAGCASSLRTFGADGRPAIGIPVASRVLVRITETTSYVVDPANPGYSGYCMPETNARYDFLPIGERIFVAFEPAALGSGEFKLELTESGVLKSVSLNSDATSGADEVGELLAAVLPYVASPKPVSEGALLRGADETAQQVKTRYCLKAGTAVTGIERVAVPPPR